ncbi:MAG: fused MFS/spermidine synthase [Lewinellaceae bacterium]|nr:fused MFS/spermidine synthase [Lewinellaceae bacterium]
MIPRWKRWLSYFVEQHIESAPSDINPHLYVSIVRGRLQLSTANAIYSFEDLYTNFGEALDRLNPDPKANYEVLLLGLGLGSIPYILEKKHGCRYGYTAVELDESVVYLAEKYTLAELESPMDVITGDAYAFVFTTEEYYDWICMDVFLDETTPEVFGSTEFLEGLQERLTPGGLLLYNCLTDQATEYQRTKLFFEQTFLTVFPQAYYFDVGGNWILVGPNPSA